MDAGGEPDRLGRFSIMSQEEYVEAGVKHVKKDEKVGKEFLMKNQKRLNGHMSMIFKMLERLGTTRQEKQRLNSPTVYQLVHCTSFKKIIKDGQWRLVASSGGGQDDHLSKRVTQVIEPVANIWTG